MANGAAIWYRPEGFSVAGERLMGRQSAGEAFLKAYVRHAALDVLACCTDKRKDFEHFQSRVADLNGPGPRRDARWVRPHSSRELSALGTLYRPDPMVSQQAWVRRRSGQRSYSICGVFHTTASGAVMDAIADFLVAPLQPWDAVICTSRAVRDTVRQVHEGWGEYLQTRFGVAVTTPMQLPVIPLGVDADAYAAGPRAEAARARWRQALGIGSEDVCALFIGRLSYHAKAHPLPMYLGLEAASRKTGRKVHLILAGWFANKAIEETFREGAVRHCPSVKLHLVDGRQADVRSEIWFAADLFTSLSDNIQETFGLTPIEGMAAGLPTVTSDWDGYRDTVRDGIDGFCVPTWQPRPGVGHPLAEAYADGRIDYDHYLAGASQFAAVEVPAASAAYTRLIADADLRRRMGAAGRERARSEFDWRRIVVRYQDLWATLAEERQRTQEVAPPRQSGLGDPRRADPFAVFRTYPTAVIDEGTRVTLAAHASAGRVAALSAETWLSQMAETRGGGDLSSRMLADLEAGPRTVSELARSDETSRTGALIRAVAWLCKVGLVELSSPSSDQDPARGVPSTGK